MSETPSTYTAPGGPDPPLHYCACVHNTLSDAGVRALQAGYEEAEHWRATWEARAMTRATERDEVRRENSQLWAALLEMLTAAQKEALQELARLWAWWGTQPDSDAWLRAGWVLEHMGINQYDALLTLPARLVERLEAYGTVSGYRLTPFGARVAAALGEG